MIRFATAISFLFLLMFGCTHRVSKFYPQIIPKKFDAELTVGPGKDSLEVLYLGCGNMILSRNGRGIITDPFFSNQKVLMLAGRIKTNEDRYRRWKETYESHFARNMVIAGLVSHTHYDHVMDLPVILHDQYFPQMKAVYGNHFLPLMLQNFTKSPAKMTVLQANEVYSPTQGDDREYSWIELASGIHVLPIESDHAPHLGKILFMSKPLKEKHFREKLVWPNEKVKARRWTVGTTFSFLIDFAGANDTLRVFLQTSASQQPYGLPPREVLDKRKVDLAIICYASALNVDEYPEKLLDFIQPDKIMLVHWEDFFRTPKTPDDVKLVRGTKPKKMKKLIGDTGRPIKDFMMPKPGTLVKLKF